MEKDKLILKIESARSGKSWEAIDDGDEQQVCQKYCGVGSFLFFCVEVNNRNLFFF